MPCSHNVNLRFLAALGLVSALVTTMVPAPVEAVAQGRAPAYVEPTVYTTDSGGPLAAGPEPGRRKHMYNEPRQVAGASRARSVFLDTVLDRGERSTLAASGGVTRAPTPDLEESFPGLGSEGDNSKPPDPAIAVGLDHVVLAINDDFAIYDKHGELLFQDDFNNISGFYTRMYFDPRCSYDPVDDRYMCITAVRRQSTNDSWWMLMVSDDDDAMGDWYVYHLDATIFGDAGVADYVWADHPYLGWDREAIYLTANMVTWARPRTLEVAKLRILDKAEIYDGQPVDWWDIWGFQSLGTWDFSIAPAQDPSWTGVTYLLSAKAWGGDTLTLIRMSNALDWVAGPTLGQEIIDVDPYSVPPSPVQTSGDTLEILGNFLEDKLARIGPNLYAVHQTGTIYEGQRDPRAALKIYRLNISDQQTAVDQDLVCGSSSADYYMPSVQPTAYHDMLIAFNRSSPTSIEPELRYTVWQNGAGPSPSALAKEGLGSYSGGRWGDYSAAQLDPVDGATVWFVGEYSLGGRGWDTWVGAVHVP